MRGTGPPGWGSLESETIKYGDQPHGIRTREWLPWRGPAGVVNIRMGATGQQTRNCLTVVKICSWASDGCLTLRQTGRLFVDRNINLI
jgi:hypothetical protein